MMLVTTRWANPSSPEYAIQVKREKLLRDLYWAEAVDTGSEMRRYANNKDSASAFLAHLNDRQRQFVPLDTSLPQHPHKQEASKSQTPDDERCPDYNSVSWWSMWNLRSATAICSAPRWTALIMILRLFLMCAFDFFFFYELGQIYGVYCGERRDTSFAWKQSALVFIISIVTLGGLPMGRFEPLEDAECVVCALTYLSIFRLPTLLFWVGPLLFICLIMLNEYMKGKFERDDREVVNFLLSLFSFIWLVEYILMW